MRYRRSTLLSVIALAGFAAVQFAVPAPATGSATAAGIVRAPDGALYVDYNAGSRSGIWRITPGCGTAVQVVAMPDVEVLNGLGADWGQDALYATDSRADTVWKVSLKTGTASLWLLLAKLG